MRDDEWCDLGRQVTILCDGWTERREFGVKVDGNCEKRIESVYHTPLLLQLRTMTHPLVRKKQEGGSGGKAGSKPPGAFEAASLLDEIHRWAYTTVQEWSDVPSRVLRRTVARELYTLRDRAGMQSHEAVQAATWHLRTYVRRARITIGYEVPTHAFADTVCGECGGQLRAAVDGVGDVFCAGTPMYGSCGAKYTPMHVISLALDMEAMSGTEAEAGGHRAGSDLLDDAAQAG